MELEKEAYMEAIKALKKVATPHGFNAAYPGYDALWSRDSMITSLGASLLENKFKNTFKQSIIQLAKHQSPKGQIPNAVDIWAKRKHHVDFMTLDSSLWFIIGNHIYNKRYNDSSLIKKYKKNIEQALTWVSYQDTSEEGMPEQQPTSDWQDAFPHRYGHTINTQALYYKCLTLEKNPLANKINKIVNTNKDVGLWESPHYLSYRWKNHNSYQEKSDWFDSLGNLLAIIFDLAPSNYADKILKHIKDKKIDKPFPIKTIYPPITEKSKYWYDYFKDADARSAYHYSNAGIWTYIGGFYVLALIKQKRFKEAQHQLEQLAKANMQKPYFNEWLNGKTGKPGGAASGENGNQAWNAGMYILAHDSVMKKKILL